MIAGHKQVESLRRFLATKRCFLIIVAKMLQRLGRGMSSRGCTVGSCPTCTSSETTGMSSSDGSKKSSYQVLDCFARHGRLHEARLLSTLEPLVPKVT